MPLSSRTIDLLRHLSARPGHDEVKADIRQLLMDEFQAEIGDTEFEKRVPAVRGRLDALIGRTIFEAKSNLDREKADVERRMPDYLADREREDGEPFVGLATDGLKWIAYALEAGILVEVSAKTLDPAKPESFLAWLDGAVALRASLAPDADTVRIELGEESVAFRRAAAELTALWSRLKDDPATALKRALWSSLLKLVYGREVESDALWVQHTFLVVVAKAIALAVLDVREDEPARMLSGRAFEAAGITGAVESDFFDWVVSDAEGVALVRRIMAQVRRFRLREVQSDVLKVLYESLIDRDERHGLGEYYTPDWLAAKVVREAVDRPLEQKVLDPACGSGTFLFHAIRRVLAEAEEAGLPAGDRAAVTASLVAGLDIHPVAVIITRVTYLLALAPALNGRVGGLSIPVYLGDAMQLSISEMMAGKELTIRVPPPPAGEGASGAPMANGGEQLDFPETFCRDPALFDKAIEQMRQGSAQNLAREQIERTLTRVTEQHYKADITKEQADAIVDLGKTYVTFDRLRREGRDSVWAYVARNLSRPLAYAAAGGWANVLVGNPPWVAFRHMSADLQKRFKEMAKAPKVAPKKSRLSSKPKRVARRSSNVLDDGEGVYVGGRFATQNDLCALFTVRSARLYLRPAGRLAFVLPLAVLTRGQFAKLREGAFTSTQLAYDAAWVMDNDVQPLFPVPSCVVFARRRATATPVPPTVRRYSGRLPMRDAPEAIADARLTVAKDVPIPTAGAFTGGSPYRVAFRQGATLVPRMLCLVERKSSGSILGSDLSAPLVASRRSTQENEPWKNLSAVETRVEREFVRPVLLGESILPYRVWRPFEGVVPVTDEGVVLDAQGAANRGYSGLLLWMKEAEEIWKKNSKNEDMTLVGRWNYHNELGAQFPNSDNRIVYAKSGALPAACIIKKGDPYIIDHLLYWAAVASINETHYLAAILNSEEARKRTAQLQSRGQFGARHFDKVIFSLAIPRFDAAEPLHAELAAAGAEAETLAASVVIADGTPFQRARRHVRDALSEAGIAPRIDALVARLLDE